MIRIVKIILVVFVGLQGLFYFISNAVNWDYAQAAVGAVLSQADAPFYKNLIVPPITNPTLVALATMTIMTGELLVGLISFKGAADLAAKAAAPAAEFNKAKTFAVLGCSMALIVWFGGFLVIGTALFQMWQGAVGVSSFEGAFMYLGSSAFVLLFLNQPDA
ncbi:MAG: DUF2165 family protein [Parvularculaceae bacterium]|nr:DUF2165 family protein [Parvularculaceae bacterium]